MPSKKQEGEKGSYRTLLLLAGAIGVLMLAYYWLVFISIDDVNERGLFGDTFGGFTALASGLAFGGMIYAIILQSRELTLQREELRLTREEMTAARVEYARAAAAQQEMVGKQMLTARIQGMAAMVQGRYQMAAARGSNADKYLEPATAAESRLVELMKEAGVGSLDLPDVR